MDHCAGICIAKRGLKRFYRKHCMLMRFIRRLVAKLGSDLLLEVTLNCKCWRRWFRGPEQRRGCFMQAGSLLAGRDYTLLPLGATWTCADIEAMRSGTRFIVTPTGGLKDIVEDGFADLWTDGKMTAEAPVEQEFSRKS